MGETACDEAWACRSRHDWDEAVGEAEIPPASGRHLRAGSGVGTDWAAGSLQERGWAEMLSLWAENDRGERAQVAYEPWQGLVFPGAPWHDAHTRMLLCSPWGRGVP